MADDISKANIDRLKDKLGFIEHILEHELTMSERVLSQWKRKLVKWNELYKMVQNQRHYEGLARLFVPEILRSVETVVGNLHKIIFGNTPWFEYLATSQTEDPAAQALSQLVTAQMEDNKFQLRTMDSLRQMAISGLTVRKLTWEFSQVNRRKKVPKIENVIDPITGKTKTNRSVETVDSVETLVDTWASEPVDLLGFHISDVMTPYHNIQKAEWVMEQTMIKKELLAPKVKSNWLVELPKDLENTNAYNQSEAERLKLDRKNSAGYASGLGNNGAPGYTDAKQQRSVEILERWGLLKAEVVYDEKELKELKLDADEMVETVCIIANRKHILKLCANPFWHNQKPYVSCPYVALDTEFAGIGVCQIGESLQEELNDTRNQVMDNKSLILMNMWLKERSSGIKNQDLRIRPMGVIQTNNINGLKPLAPPVLSGVGINIENVIKEDLRQSTGASSNLQGIAQSGVNTATESNYVTQASAGRLSFTAQQYAELVLKPTLAFAESLNYQYFDTDKIIRMIGEEGIKFQKISPNDIVGAKTVEIKLAIDQDNSPSVRRQQLLQMLTIVQSMPPQLIQFHWRLLDRIYKSFFPSANSLEDLYQAPPSEEVLLDPEEEFEIMRQGIPVKVKQGDDDKKHIAAHEKDIEDTKFALSPSAWQVNQEHLLEHYNQLMSKEAASQQQQMAQMQAMAQPQGKGQGGMSAQGNTLNPGQMPGVTPFTNRAASSPGDLARNNGGM